MLSPQRTNQNSWGTRAQGENDSSEILGNIYQKSKSHTLWEEIPLKNGKSCTLNLEVINPSTGGLHLGYYWDAVKYLIMDIYSLLLFSAKKEQTLRNI